MKTFTALLLAASMLSGCTNRDQVPVSELDRFAQQFLTSVRDDTPFHRAFLEPAERAHALALRPELAKPWRVFRWDGPSILDEGIICLANGSLAHLIARQTARKVTSVRLVHLPRHRCS